MEELYNELRKLGATVEEPCDELGYFTRINGVKMHILAFEKGGKTRYEVGSKKLSNVKNAAYYILGEYLPEQNRRKRLDKAIADMGEGLPDNTLWHHYDDRFGVCIRVRTAEELKAVIKHMASRIAE